MTAVPDSDRRTQAAPSRRAVRRAARAATAAAVLALVVAAAGTASAQEGPGFAAPEEVTVAPGAMTRTAGGAQCTANFVFTDGSDVFIGQAAHCSGTGAITEVDGCRVGSLPLGTPVEIEGAEHPGTLAYSSWSTMQETGESDPDTCRHNDFALVRIDPGDIGRTSPTVPFYGGPTGVDPDGTRAGERVFGYGNSSLRQGIGALRPRTGISLGTSGSGWTHQVVTVLPGVPGDSGSAFLSGDGAALGVLSTLDLAPATGTNGVSDLRSALDYANGPGGFGGALRLVDGDRPFTPNPAPVDLG